MNTSDSLFNDASGMESPSGDFTSRLMKELEAEELALSRVLRQDALLEPSSSFVAAVAGQVEKTTLRRPYQPVIPRYAWYILAACFAGMVAFLSNMPSTETSSATDVSKRITSFGEELNQLFAHHSFFSYLLPTLCILLVFFTIQSMPRTGKSR